MFVCFFDDDDEKKNNKINYLWIRRPFCNTQDNVLKRKEVIKKTKSECREPSGVGAGEKTEKA